jgi:hypothetical protein
MDDDKDSDASSHSVFPLKGPGGLAFSNSEKAKALADSLEAQFRPVDEPSGPTFIQTVKEAMGA